MKNKFKKSKIIVSALALITATTVASVTGTVAWFTANRAVTISALSFVSTKVESNIQTTLTQGEGTTVSGTTVTVSGKLTHGSYNAMANKNGSVYVASLNDNKAVTGYLDKGTFDSHTKTTAEEDTTSTNFWLAKDHETEENKIWYAVSWTMNFKYTASVDGETNYLLFAPGESTFAGTNATSGGTGTGDTYKGFRIAFMTATNYLVLGGDSTAKHVKGTASTDTENFTNYEDLTASNKTAKLNDNDSTLSTSKYSFGNIDGTTGVTIYCVAWFEGEDSNIVNQLTDSSAKRDTIMSSVSASLNFYTRSVNDKKTSN